MLPDERIDPESMPPFTTREKILLLGIPIIGILLVLIGGYWLIHQIVTIPQ